MRALSRRVLGWEVHPPGAGEDLECEDDAVWRANALQAHGQLFFAAFKDDVRCDVFLSVIRGFMEAGLDLAEQ